MSSQTQPQPQPQTQAQVPPAEGKSFGEKIGDCSRSMCSCFGSRDDDDEVEDVRPRKTLVISGPTNFRREELNIAGLTPSQEKFIREKQARDAEKLYAHLQPLASSPSGTFAERPHSSAFPTFEQFIQPRRAPSPHSSRIDRVMAHGRKLSDTFRSSLGSPGSGGGPYHAVGGDGVELGALVEPTREGAVGQQGSGSDRAESPRPGMGAGTGTGKMSEESFSRTTMTEESSAEREMEGKKGVEAKL